MLSLKQAARTNQRAGMPGTTMTPLERRGMWLYLGLAGLVAAEQLAGAALAIAQGLAAAAWFRALVQPCCLLVAVAYLGFGENWVRWFVALACALTGLVRLWQVTLFWHGLGESAPPEHRDVLFRVQGVPLGVALAIGIFYLLVCVCLLLSPGLKAFFAFRRRTDAPPGS